MQLRTIVAIVAAFALGGAIAMYVVPKVLGPPSTAVKLKEVGKVNIGGPFTLTDHTGKTVTEKDFRGKYMLVFFGYTFCPDVCPTELQIISAALDELGDLADQITPVFITVDPERDTPEQMASYIANFHKSFVGLTGTPEQIKAVAKAYRAYYAKVPNKDDPENYAMDHSAIVYLMDKDGVYATHFAYGTPAKKMAAKIRDILTGKTS